jgi:sulfate transport system permease protein
MPEPRAAWTRGRIVLLAVVILYLGLILVLPLGALVSRASAGGFKPLVDVFANPEARRGLAMTIGLAAAALVVNGLFGVAGALVLVRQRFPLRGVVDALVDLPFAISPVMVGLAFLLLFGRGGTFHPILDAMDWRVVFAFPGVLIATLFVTLPFTLREVAYVLAELGEDEERAAATLGASRWQTFWRVTLPNIRFGLGYGATLTVARALGEFGAVLVLGGAISGRTQTATTFIYTAVEERQESAAYGMALVLALASALLLVLLELFKARVHKAESR